MKRVFISQPMNNLSDVEILSTRAAAAQAAQTYLGEEIEVMDSYRPHQGPNALFNLGQTISMMSQADLAYFTAGWANTRGCRVEHLCAVEYGLPFVDVDAET